MDKEYIKRVEENLGGVRERIRMAAGERNVTLLAATKTVSAEVINHAAENLGLTVIGENKVQELLEKYPLLCRDKLEIHLIGHLQTNKVRQIVDKVDMIESLDREDLAKEISKRALAIGKRMPVLVEINVGKEPEKSGVYPEDTEAFVREMAKYEGIEIVGLMTMAPAKISSEEYKAYFSQVKAIFDSIAEKSIPGVRMETLSMGMSDSYAEGAECGATMVRVGSAIFGKRVYPEQNV